MSREFGAYECGYFHRQMEIAANDCKCGDDDLTKLWGEFFEKFYPVAYAIASSEAGDASPSFPIMENIKHMPEIKRALRQIENYLQPFSDVADKAVREFMG